MVLPYICKKFYCKWKQLLKNQGDFTGYYSFYL